MSVIDQLLDFALKAMNGNDRELRFLEQMCTKKPRLTKFGIERWFQIELMTEADSLGIEPLVRSRKEPKKPDLKVDNMRVELKAEMDYNLKYVRDGFQTNPDAVLFLARTNEKFQKDLEGLKTEGCKVELRSIGSSPAWIVGYLARM